MEVPPRDELLSVYTVCLAEADRAFPAEFCKNPLPMLAAVIGILTATEADTTIPDESKTQVSEAIRYMAERLATLQVLVDDSTPAINAAQLFPSGAKRTPARMMLNDIARGLARRVPLTKLVQLDGDVRPYLASLMIAALHKAGDELVLPDDMRIRKVTTEAFENMLKADAGKAYDNYGMIA